MAPPSRSFAVVVAGLLGLSGSACGAGAEGGGEAACDPDAPPSRTIACVQSLAPGDGAGFGMDRYPDVVFGEPRGKGDLRGSLDVLSLGMGGDIVFGFGGSVVVDRDGPDFVVFENAFYVGGDPQKPFTDLAEVAVSDDGEAWTTFPCAADAFPYEGCAGRSPVHANPDEGISAFDPEVSGGEAFDLATVGLASARLVRIRDLGLRGGGEGMAGFDLDAAAILGTSE